MRNSLTILGAAIIISLGIYFGLARNGSNTTLPPVGAAGPGITVTQPPKTPFGSTTDIRRVINQLNIYVEDANQISRSVQEAFARSGYADIANHAEELEKLAQNIRQATVDLPPEESRIIRILVGSLQHSAHELQGAASSKDHEHAHHAFEGFEEQLDTIEKEIQRFGLPRDKSFLESPRLARCLNSDLAISRACRDNDCRSDPRQRAPEPHCMHVRRLLRDRRLFQTI